MKQWNTGLKTGILFLPTFPSFEIAAKTKNDSRVNMTFHNNEGKGGEINAQKNYSSAVYRFNDSRSDGRVFKFRQKANESCQKTCTGSEKARGGHDSQ